MAQPLVKRRLKLRQDWYPKFFGCLVLSSLEALLHKCVRDSLVGTSVVAGGHEQLLPYEVQDQELASYNKALKQRGSLSIWFDAEMPCGKRGRQREFSDAAIQVCLTMKVLSGLPLRQTAGFGESLLRLAGLNWKVPDFSTLCR